MTRFSETVANRKLANRDALSAFGIQTSNNGSGTRYRDVHVGQGATVFTIGYERRSGVDLIDDLKDAGVEMLVDVREKPFSRKADFRKTALHALCESAGIEYCSLPELGSTKYQRDLLQETGNFSLFRKRFRDLMTRTRWDAIAQLSELAAEQSIAMICYERCHDECHRSVLAQLLAEEFDAHIVAIG